MSTKEILSDIESLINYFRRVLQDPKNSDKAGQIHDLFKRLNLALDKVARPLKLKMVK